MIVFSIILFMIFYYINKKVYKNKLCYLNIIELIWVLLVILTKINPYNLFGIVKEAYIYAFEFIVLLEITSIISYKLPLKKKTDDYEVNWKLSIALLLMCIIIISPFAFKGLEILIKNGNFNSIRDAYLNYRICSNKVYLITTIFIVPLAEAVGFYAIVRCLKEKKINLGVKLFVIFNLELILETGGRGRILNYIILIGFFLIYNNESKSIKKLMKENKKVISIVATLIIVIGFITAQRRLSGQTSIFYNIYIYFTGPFQLFSQYLTNKSFLSTESNLLYGQVLTSGITMPFYSLLNMLGGNLKAGYYIVNEITSQYMAISNSTIINNGGTFLYYAARDFGRLGPIIYTIIFSILYNNIYKKKNSNIFYETLFYFLLIKFVFFFNEYCFGQSSTIMTCIYFKMLTKRVKKR